MKEEKIKKGARDFSNRFVGVMKDLAEEQNIEEKIIEEFDKKFVRDDGLMDKYTYEYAGIDDFEGITMAEAIKIFFRQKFSLHRQEVEKETRERVLEEVRESIKSLKGKFDNCNNVDGRVQSECFNRNGEVDKHNKFIDYLLTILSKIEE